MIVTEYGKQIEPGDKIHCKNWTVTVGEKIYYNAYWKESDGSDNHYCEFLDTKGGYHYWKQALDGGYVIPKEHESDKEQKLQIAREAAEIIENNHHKAEVCIDDYETPGVERIGVAVQLRENVKADVYIDAQIESASALAYTVNEIFFREEDWEYDRSAEVELHNE